MKYINYALIVTVILVVISAIIFVKKRINEKFVVWSDQYPEDYPNPFDETMCYHTSQADKRRFYNDWIEHHGNWCSRETLGMSQWPDVDPCRHGLIMDKCEPNYWSDNITKCLGSNWNIGYITRCKSPQSSTPPPPTSLDIPTTHHEYNWSEPNSVIYPQYNNSDDNYFNYCIFGKNNHWCQDNADFRTACKDECRIPYVA